MGIGFGKQEYKPHTKGNKYIVEPEETAKECLYLSPSLEAAKADALYLKRKTGRNHIILKMIGIVK